MLRFFLSIIYLLRKKKSVKVKRSEIYYVLFLTQPLPPFTGGAKIKCFFSIVKLILDMKFEVNLIKNAPSKCINENNDFWQLTVKSSNYLKVVFLKS